MENKATPNPNLLLKNEREQRFWTQEEVARQVGTSPVNVSRWERGITSPSLYFRNKLCEIFEKSPQELGLVEDYTVVSPVQATSRVGEVFASYRLDDLLGQGEIADVYVGEHLRLRNEAVVKVFSTRLTSENEGAFLDEARTIARLVHPHILRVLDYGVEAGVPYLVMDYAPKGSLRYPQGERVPLGTVVSYVQQVAEALQYAHGKQVIHRNIKPENMLLGEQSDVMLTDFGMTLAIENARPQRGGNIPRAMTYMAPELLQGHPCPASDQYALAAVVYEWLAGGLPTVHVSLTKVVGQTVLVVAPFTPMPGRLTTVSPEVEEVVLTALAQDPGKRFGSVQAFAKALEQAFVAQPKDLNFALSSSTVPLTELPSAAAPSAGQRPPARMPISSSPVRRRPPAQMPINPPPAAQRHGGSPPPFSPASASSPPATRSQRRTVPPLLRQRHLLLPLLILLLVLTIFGVTASLFAFRSGPSSLTPSSNSIVVTRAQDGESIGISDGTFAFDTSRLDGGLKLKAADRLKARDVAGAQSLWEQAIANDTNDAEALIYLEDQRVLASGHAYLTLVAGTVLTGTFTDAGRASLQGAYVAQKEYNDQCFKFPGCLPVRLLVANAGSGDSANSGVGYASLVMEQIVSAVRVDKTIVGVMGWPLSSSSLYLNTILGSAGIPVVSPTASIAPSTLTLPYFFSVAPSIERQGSVGAQYAEQGLHARRVALFVDPVDRYSESLANAFSRQFTAEGNAIVDTENYTVGKSDTIPPRLQVALNYHPDLIYFAGHSSDAGALLAGLPPCESSTCLQVLGGDALYELNYPSSARNGLYRLHFTAYAYPDEWEILAPTAQLQKPAFFTEYPQYFDPNNQHSAGTYGYDRANSGVILSYDAIQTLLNASSIALSGGNPSITPGDLQRTLTQITGSQSWQGASGRISFGPDGTPANKVVLILHWSPNIQIQFDQVYGCFLKPLPTAPPNPACS